MLLSYISHRNHLCPHWYPFNPGWREAIIVKCLAQGHKFHNQDSNPHSAEQKHQNLNPVLLCTWPLHPSVKRIVSEKVIHYIISCAFLPSRFLWSIFAVTTKSIPLITSTYLYWSILNECISFILTKWNTGLFVFGANLSLMSKYGWVQGSHRPIWASYWSQDECYTLILSCKELFCSIIYLCYSELKIFRGPLDEVPKMLSLAQ